MGLAIGESLLDTRKSSARPPPGGAVECCEASRSFEKARHRAFDNMQQSQSMLPLHLQSNYSILVVSESRS
jgi:hypothetical protein